MDRNTTSIEPALEKQLKGHRNAITALYFSPNEERVASGSLDNSVMVIFPVRSYYHGYRKPHALC